MKYFAYGSNMCSSRLRARVPSAVHDQNAALYNFALKFHKRSSDGSAKCDAFHTGNQADKVYGVVFEIDDSEKTDLDEYEGRGRGYDQITIRAHTDSGVMEMFTYVAAENAIDDSLEPYSWYRDFVLAGAIEHALPDFYVRRIRDVKTKEDRNKDRDKRNRSLLPPTPDR
jgi:gamma-glutamylcyclotransferase